MSFLKNALIFTGLGGGVTLFLLGRLKQAEKDIEVIPKFKISSFSLSGMTLEIDLTVKNPTGVKLNIMYPFMRLMLGNSPIGSSQVVNQVITIPAYGEAQIDKIQIQVSLLEELDLALSLFTPLQTGQAVNAELVTQSALSFWFGNIPFTRTNTVTLKTA